MSWLPNAITTCRLVLVLPIGIFLWIGEYGLSFLCLVIAGLSDALDGYLARKLNSISRFGELADPIADKLVVFVVVLLLLFKELLPFWVAAIVVGREIVIVTGALAFRQIVHELEISPLYISRVNTFVQVVILMLILISQTEIGSYAKMIDTFINEIGLLLLVGFAIASGLAYVVIWSMRVRDYLSKSQDQVE